MSDLIFEPGRVVRKGADGAVLAEVTFPEISPGLVNISHTFVDPQLRGQGAGGQLLEAVVAQLRRRQWKARVTCPYAVRWFARHPEYGDVLAK